MGAGLGYLAGRYNRAAGTRDAFGRLSDALVAEGYPRMVSNSGDREPQDQIDIFLSKFVPSSGPRDVGPYGDRRYWPGHGWWKRTVGNGTVGVPGSSNHEKRRSNDLLYPYSDDTKAHRRAQQLAERFNITCEGMGFREWWHWTYWGALGAISSPGSGAGSGTEIPEEVDDGFMKFYLCKDQGAKVPLWSLVNEATGEIVQTRDGGNATTWHRIYGKSYKDLSEGQADGGVNDFLTVLAAVKATTTRFADVQEDLDALMKYLETQKVAT